ncbi:hypothetical protein [Panacagrimonas perspica]|nr:hypothetical protein [Panacagrimonas perspica]
MRLDAFAHDQGSMIFATSPRRLAAGLCLLVCAWFFAATLCAAFRTELGFDPAYHANVAKSFVLGQGWATHYERSFPFNPDVTTGPTLLLPAAAMIAVFGNALWVPAVTAACVHLAIFLLILLRLRGFGLKGTAAAALCVAFTLYAHTWWLSLTADFVVVLLLVLACVLLAEPDPEASPRSRLRRSFVAGVCVGLALLAKALAWFGVVGLALYGLVAFVRGARSGSDGLRAGVLVLGLMAAVLPWKLYEAASLRTLPAEQRAERADYASEFLRTQGSGIAEWETAPSRIALLGSNLKRNASVLARDFEQRYGLPGWTGIVAMAGLLLFTLLLMRQRPDPLRRLLLMLGLIGSVQAAWFLLLSQSWSAKYALAPTLLAIVVLCLASAQRGRLRYLLALGAVVVMLQPSAAARYQASLLRFETTQSAYTRDLASTRDYLQRTPMNVPLAGCGWVFAPWETEYALPGVGHFRDCRRLIREALAFDDAYYLDQHPAAREQIERGQYRDALDHHLRTDAQGTTPFRFRWIAEPSFVLVVNHVFWRISAYRESDRAVLEACLQHPLHQTDYFTVALCSADALRDALPLDRPSAFLPVQDDGGFVRKPAPLPLR